MTFSDSLPIQFWNIDDETHNEKSICGLAKQDCFCQPFECSDEIIFQVQNTSAPTLDVFDSSDNLLVSLAFVQQGTGVWETTFIADDNISPSLCNTEIQFKIRQVSTGQQYIAKSDCISIKTPQDCTKLISYQNSTDFDGLIYGGTSSPDPTFYLRVPAMFYEEKNPQEQEDLELSNGHIVTIRQSIQEKRLLELGFMPGYMHRKLQKVLMHGAVIIDGDQWKKRDAYEDQPVKKYNLKRASVLLTKYDSVEKNTI